MTTRDKKNISYKRNRYKNKEWGLEITPDSEAIERGVDTVKMEGISKDEMTTILKSILSALNDLVKRKNGVVRGKKEVMDKLRYQQIRDSHRDFVGGESSRASHQTKNDIP